MLNRSLCFAFAVACALTSTQASAKSANADSIRDFSAKQGHRHWFYGFVRPDSKNPQFQKLVQTGQPDLRWTHSDPNKFWTAIWAEGQHPNGTNGNQGRKKIEEWSIRRWISPQAGSVHVAGTIGGNGGGGGQVVASVVVDGETRFTSVQANTDAVPFAFDATLSAGSVVDFVLAPRDHFDVNDSTPFSETIKFK